MLSVSSQVDYAQYALEKRRGFGQALAPLTTPAHLLYACQKGFNDLARAINRRNGVSLDACGPRAGWTVMHYAAKRADVDWGKWLIAMGAPLDGQLKTSRWTPLHYAVARKCTPLVKALIKGGARLDLRDNKGKTPFDLACKHLDLGFALYVALAGSPRGSCTGALLRRVERLESGEITLLGQLPSEVRVHIYSLLPADEVLGTMRLVCREWAKAVALDLLTY